MLIFPPRIRAIDPVNCGCTECGPGEYVSLDLATPEQIAALLLGEIANHTETTLAVVVHYDVTEGMPLAWASPSKVIVTSGELTWTLDPGMFADPVTPA